MSRPRILIDTGPLVAIVSRKDAAHDRCVAELAELPTPLLTCWPVLTEALWLVRHNPAAIAGLFRGFSEGLWELVPLDREALPPLEEFLKRYRKLQCQIADACLVHLAEREKIDTVFTLDRRDFSVYRTAKNRRLNIIPAQH